MSGRGRINCAHSRPFAHTAHKTQHTQRTMVSILISGVWCITTCSINCSLSISIGASIKLCAPFVCVCSVLFAKIGHRKCVVLVYFNKTQKKQNCTCKHLECKYKCGKRTIAQNSTIPCNNINYNGLSCFFCFYLQRNRSAHEYILKLNS